MSNSKWFHREALATDYTGRQLRLMFALSPWDRPMQYGQQAADEMQAKETLLKNFFQNVEVVMRQRSTVHTSKWAVRLFFCLTAVYGYTLNSGSSTFVIVMLCMHVNAFALVGCVYSCVNSSAAAYSVSDSTLQPVLACSSRCSFNKSCTCCMHGSSSWQSSWLANMLALASASCQYWHFNLQKCCVVTSPADLKLEDAAG